MTVQADNGPDKPDDSAEQLAGELNNEEAPEEETPEEEVAPEEEKAGDDKAKQLKADVVKERKRRQAAEAELRRLKTEGASETEKAQAQAIEENDAKWAGRFKTAAARAALAEAGVPSEKLGRAIKVLDLDALEVGDDGDVDGIDGEVTALKDSFPELFATVEAKGRKAPRVTPPGQQSSEKKMSSAERLAASLTGG